MHADFPSVNEKNVLRLSKVVFDVKQKAKTLKKQIKEKIRTDQSLKGATKIIE